MSESYSISYGDQVRNALSAKLGQQAQVSCGRPAHSAEDLEALSGSGAAVIVCALNDTRRADLDENIQLCLENQVPVLGVVIVNIEA